MKNISILEISFSSKNQRFIERLKVALNSLKYTAISKNYSGIKAKTSLLRPLKINNIAKKQKGDEFYICLDKFDSADIYLANDGVQKIYKKLYKFWFLSLSNFIAGQIEKKCVQNATKIIANSNLTRFGLETVYNLDPNKLVTIYPGITPPIQIQKGRAKMRLCNELGLNMELPVMLFVSDDFRADGAREFIELLSRLETKVNALIIGSDKAVLKYRKIAQNLGVTVIFRPSQTIMNHYYEAADIFVLPSHYNSFSNQLLEALSYGCACFTTEQNGASEILGSEFVMKNASDQSIDGYINLLLTDHDLLLEISGQNSEIAREFSVEKNLNEILKVIGENIH